MGTKNSYLLVHAILLRALWRDKNYKTLGLEKELQRRE